MPDLLHTLWRRLPVDLRRRALVRITGALAPRPRSTPPASPAISVAGYFRAQNGLGEGARRLADMFDAIGLPALRVDLTGALRQGPPGPTPSLATGPGTLLLHVNGPLLPWSLLVLGRSRLRSKRIVAFWNWELQVLPQEWGPTARHVHAIWAPSRHTAMAISAATGCTVPVVPYHVPEPDPAPLLRDDFGLPATAFVSLAIFDAASGIERKNPLGAIAAHQRAFGDSPDHVLVLKTQNGAHGGRAWRQARAAAAALPNVRVIDRELPRRDLWALMALADVVVSLHRAEGVGLHLAEAMRLGKPVLATAWSGNMDFMDAGSAALVPCRLVPPRDERRVYAIRGALWAEPDLDEAARLLRRLAGDPGWRRALGARGLERVATLTARACGERAAALLGLAPRPSQCGGVPA